MEEFQRPTPKQIGVLILEEDEYLEKLEKIIQRDFFPELKSLEELKNGKPLDIDNAIEGVSLSDFLSNYTSDENQTFHEIIQREDGRWKEKHQWMFDVQNKHNQKLLAIEAEQNKLSNMVEGSRTNQLQVCEFTTINQLYFPRNIRSNLTAEHNEKAKKTMIENTRLEQHDKPFGFAVEQINQKLKDTMKEKLQEKLNQHGIEVNFFGSTPNLMGYYGSKQEQLDKYGHIDLDQLMQVGTQKQQPVEKQKPRVVGGYQMLQMPSPSPNQLKTPLMTWGEIGETPKRLDRGYKIPNTPQRDQLASDLASQICNKKKATHKLQQEILKKRLLGLTPSRMDSVLSRQGSQANPSLENASLSRSILKPIISTPLEKQPQKKIKRD